MSFSKKSIRFAISILCIIILLVLLGYLRDSVFKSVNALLRAWDNDQDYYLPSPLSFLENYEYDTLVNIKWLLTLIFSLIYFVIGIFSLRLVFGDNRYLGLLITAYLSVIVLSVMFIGTGMLFSGVSAKMYQFARYLMGMAQSPIILMILIPALKLSEKEKEQSGN